MCSDNQYGPDCKFPVVGSNDCNNIANEQLTQISIYKIQKRLPKKNKTFNKFNKNCLKRVNKQKALT